MSLFNVLLVTAGAAVGSSLRYSTDVWLTHYFPELPAGTIVVNSLGSLMIGALLAVSPSSAWWLLGGVGFCGSFTTFSTLSFQLYRSWRTHGWFDFSLLLTTQLTAATFAVVTGFWGIQALAP